LNSLFTRHLSKFKPFDFLGKDDIKRQETDPTERIWFSIMVKMKGRSFPGERLTGEGIEVHTHPKRLPGNGRDLAVPSG
jgi:hypothetical protein